MIAAASVPSVGAEDLITPSKSAEMKPIVTVYSSFPYYVENMRNMKMAMS